MIDWDVRPLKGLGPLDFRMKRAEIGTLLGPPRSQRQHAPDDYRESRGQGARGYDVILGYDPDLLTDATFPSQPNEITIFGLKVFHVDPDALIDQLKQENGGFYAVIQETLFAFERLGVVLSDWRDLRSSDRWFTAGNAKGYGIMTGSSEPDEIVR